MKENVIYLAELAKKLEDLGNGVARGEMGGLEAHEVDLLLEKVRDLFIAMEERLDFVARVLESRGGIIH